MLKISHHNTFCFSRYAHVKFVKYLFANIHKQQNMSRINLYFFKNLRTSRVNNSRTLRLKNAKFSGYCFYMNTNIQGDSPIGISVPLRIFHVLTKFVFSSSRLSLAETEFKNQLTGCRMALRLRILENSGSKPATQINHFDKCARKSKKKYQL